MALANEKAFPGKTEVYSDMVSPGIQAYYRLVGTDETFGQLDQGAPGS